MAQMRAQQEQLAAAADPAPAPTVSEGAIEGFDENNRETWGTPGRNDPCPCGSGKKFKHCHGRV